MTKREVTQREVRSNQDVAMKRTQRPDTEHANSHRAKRVKREVISPTSTAMMRPGKRYKEDSYSPITPVSVLSPTSASPLIQQMSQQGAEQSSRQVFFPTIKSEEKPPQQQESQRINSGTTVVLRFCYNCKQFGHSRSSCYFLWSSWWPTEYLHKYPWLRRRMSHLKDLGMKGGMAEYKRRFQRLEDAVERADRNRNNRQNSSRVTISDDFNSWCEGNGHDILYAIWTSLLTD